MLIICNIRLSPPSLSIRSCFREMLHRHRIKLKVSAPAYAIGKDLLRPLTGWNLSFEDIKCSILANGACDATKRSMVTQGCFEHNEERGGTSVIPLMCSPFRCLCILLRSDGVMQTDII